MAICARLVFDQLMPTDTNLCVFSFWINAYGYKICTKSKWIAQFSKSACALWKFAYVPVKHQTEKKKITHKEDLTSWEEQYDMKH